MRAIKILVATTVVMSILVGGATGIVAANHEDEIGASGECGGSATDVAITANNSSQSDENDDGIDEPEPQQTVEGFVYLIGHQGCKASDDQGGYIEVHATGNASDDSNEQDDGHIQVCVDDTDTQPDEVSTGNSTQDEPCPTSQPE